MFKIKKTVLIVSQANISYFLHVCHADLEPKRSIIILIFVRHLEITALSTKIWLWRCKGIRRCLWDTCEC